MTAPEHIQNAETILSGIPASPGIAIGSAVIHSTSVGPAAENRLLDHEEIPEELELFAGALRRAENMISRTESLAQDDLMSQSAIFEALRMMLHDPALTGGIELNIKSGRMTAQAAIRSHLESLADVFTSLQDDTMRSRAEDIRALETHLLHCLNDTPRHGIHDHHKILVSHAVSPVDVVDFARANVPALVLETGGINSHAAILARSFGLPMIAALPGARTRIPPEATIVVDGYVGQVIINPDPDTLERYTARKGELEARRLAMKELRDLPPQTVDGVLITLAANIDVLEEIDIAIENGARKIGLLRTEFTAPYRLDTFSVEDQTEHYRRIAERAFPMTVTMRAFDAGRDKPFAVGPNPEDRASESPLGMCGVRYLLKHQHVLRRQIEAMLRASTMKNLRLMIPMVISADDMRRVNAIVEEVRADLRAQNVKFDEHLGIGAMIETPAAALNALAIARQSDFLSIGTNDLTQYTLAVDRTDSTLASYYDELHPAVLQLIRAAVVAAERADVPITICGELAAHHHATEVLLGLGLTRFSVSPAHLPELKRRVRSVDTRQARELARMALRMDSSAQVRQKAAERVDT